MSVMAKELKIWLLPVHGHGVSMHQGSDMIGGDSNDDAFEGR